MGMAHQNIKLLQRAERSEGEPNPPARNLRFQNFPPHHSNLTPSNIIYVPKPRYPNTNHVQLHSRHHTPPRPPQNPPQKALHHHHHHHSPPHRHEQKEPHLHIPRHFNSRGSSAWQHPTSPGPELGHPLLHLGALLRARAFPGRRSGPHKADCWRAPRHEGASGDTVLEVYHVLHTHQTGLPWPGFENCFLHLASESSQGLCQDC